MNALHIAPCGMNCALCIGFRREKNKCQGCNGHDRSKPEYCRSCKVVVCEKRKALPVRPGEVVALCYDCPDLPCARIKQLDKRYRTRYGMSMMENLAYIKEHGLDAFLKYEEERWRCGECGATLSVHRTACVECGHPREVMIYE